MLPARIYAIRLLGVAVYVLSLWGVQSASAQTATASLGEAVYQKRCAKCHDQPGTRAPARDSLQKLPAVRILKTLDFGLMMGVAYPLKREEREAVANYLGTPGPEPPVSASSYCTGGAGAMQSPSKEA